MPTVPFDPRSQRQPTPSAQPTPQQLLMALATMHSLGRLNPVPAKFDGQSAT